MNATAYGISKTGVSIQVAVKMLKGTVEWKDSPPGGPRSPWPLTSHLSPLTSHLFPIISVATACRFSRLQRERALGLASATSRS